MPTSIAHFDSRPAPGRLEACERADLGVSQELAVTFARWGVPVVLSTPEAEQRARDCEALARMARQAVRR